ncbi:MAG: Glycosyl transferase, group 1 family protein [uncultured bacterium]|nr:MAG: Glycosyl transferase, group 1 family protein [uncultured bacterium]
MRTKEGFWRITFDTNPNDCNLHCIMCEHHSRYSSVETNRILANRPKEQMSIELIRRVLEDARGSNLREIIPSTMGEPLLFKDFEQIVELCKEFKVKLNLTTNGTFPIKGVASWAKLIVPIASDVKISWNGATKSTQEKIMQGSNFEKGIQNVKDFLKIRNDYANTGKNYCQTTLQLTFMETNLPELVDIVRLGIDLGIDRIKGHHLWTNFVEIEPLSLRRSAESIARWNDAVSKIKRIAAERLLPNGKAMSLMNFDVLDGDATQNLMPEGVCPFLGEEAWIAPDGRFSPCCAPDALRRQLGNFGNVSEKDIMSIWHNKDYRHLVKNYMQNSVCVACNMRRPPVESYCPNEGINK